MNIEKWEAPKTGKQVQHYLRFFNYFREHIPLFAMIVAPLDTLRHMQNLSDRWGKHENDTFDTLK